MMYTNVRCAGKETVYPIFLKWEAYNSSRMELLEELIRDIHADRETNLISQSVFEILSKNYHAEYSRRYNNMEKLENIEEFRRWRKDRTDLSSKKHDSAELLDVEEELLAALMQLSEEKDA